MFIYESVFLCVCVDESLSVNVFHYVSLECELMFVFVGLRGSVFQ